MAKIARKSKIKKIGIEIHPNFDLIGFMNKADEFYAAIIERYLAGSGLSKEQKAELIDKLIAVYG